MYFTEKRLLTLKNRTRNFNYGIELIRKFPNKFLLTEIVNELFTKDSIKNNDIIKELIKIIASKQYQLHESESPYYISPVFTKNKNLFSEDEILELLNDIKSSTYKSTIKYYITSYLKFSKRTYIDNWELFDVLRAIQVSVNDWVNPWRADDDLRLFVVMNNLDL